MFGAGKNELKLNVNIYRQDILHLLWGPLHISHNKPHPQLLSEHLYTNTYKSNRVIAGLF